LVLSFLSIFVSCKEDEVIQTELPYLFRPIDFKVETSKTKATISWAKVDSAVSYTIQISQDSLEFTDIIITETITESPYIVELAGDTRYSVRIKANAGDPAKDSKYNDKLTFKTPPENLFESYYSAMNEQNSAEIKWLPNQAVTQLVFKTSGASDLIYTITAEEKLAGKKSCTNLPNATYNVELYNGQFLRGTNTVVIEGDYFLNKGDNLLTVLGSITGSAVVVLKPGVYSLGATEYQITNSIKIKGLFRDSTVTLCMDGASSSGKMFNINTTSRLDFIRFENIEFSGYNGGGTSGTKYAYLINQSAACEVGEFSFSNCTIRNLGNTPFRLQNATGTKKIENLIFNGCTIFDIGYASVYAIVNSNVVTGIVDNIKFTNSTIYNYAGSLIVHTSIGSNSVLVENCTFNEITTSGTGTSIRYIIDYNAQTVAAGISIRNCIFGSSPRPYNAGIRASAGTTSTISGSYFTTDYNDNNGATPYSIIGSLTAYPGASDALFEAPLTGNFKIKDAGFAGKKTAGALKWRL
jgi:hypothetical protein